VLTSSTTILASGAVCTAAVTAACQVAAPFAWQDQLNNPNAAARVTDRRIPCT
jgi:hypothetical protein